MKKIFILYAITSFLLSRVAFSQSTSIEGLLKSRLNPEEMPKISTKEAVKLTDSTVYIRDTIYGYRLINQSLVILYVGGKFPNQILSVLIKGKATNDKLKFMRKGIGHFTGKITNYKGKPAIIISDQYQMGTRIMI